MFIFTRSLNSKPHTQGYRCLNKMSTSIETLAEKLNGKLWTKGDLKRIYMDEGHNTKKMSTKTFIFEKDGEFHVSCHIECPSQPYQWISSQEEEVKKGIYEDIEQALATEVFVIKNTVTGKYEGYQGKLNNADIYYSNDKAEAAIQGIISLYNYTDYSVEKWDRTEFESEVEKLDEAERAENAAAKLIAPVTEPVEVNTIKAEPKTISVPANFVGEFKVGSNYKSPRFGIGELISENETTVIIRFSEGEKQLLKQFAKLERI